MSVRIGEVNPQADVTAPNKADVHVWASTGSVEVHSEPKLQLSPVAARNYAALLVRAADEVERMCGREPRPELSEPLVWQKDPGLNRWTAWTYINHVLLVVLGAKDGSFVWEMWTAGSIVTSGRVPKFEEAKAMALNAARTS